MSYVKIDNYDIEYTCEGNGPAMLFLHGWGCDCRTMRVIIEPMSAHHTVYSLSFPGHGGSSPVDGVWGVGNYADLVLRFMNELNITKADLVCHSFGARIGIILAANEPHRIGKMLFTGGAGIKPKRSLKYYVKVWSYKIAKFFFRLVGADTEKLARKRGSSDYAALKPNERATFSRIVNEDLTPLLSRIKCPTLLIWGKNDTATPLYMAHTMKRLIPDCGLVELEGTHFVFLEQSAHFNTIAQCFFKEV